MLEAIKHRIATLGHDRLKGAARTAEGARRIVRVRAGDDARALQNESAAGIETVGAGERHDHAATGYTKRGDGWEGCKFSQDPGAADDTTSTIGHAGSVAASVGRSDVAEGNAAGGCAANMCSIDDVDAILL